MHATIQAFSCRAKTCWTAFPHSLHKIFCTACRVLKLCAGYSQAAQNCSYHQHPVLKSFSVCSYAYHLSCLFLNCIWINISDYIGGKCLDSGLMKWPCLHWGFILQEDRRPNSQFVILPLRPRVVEFLHFWCFLSSIKSTSFWEILKFCKHLLLKIIHSFFSYVILRFFFFPFF